MYGLRVHALVHCFQRGIAMLPLLSDKVITRGDAMPKPARRFQSPEEKDLIVYKILSNGYVSTNDKGNYKFTRFSNDLNISELNIHERDKSPLYKAWIAWLEVC